MYNPNQNNNRNSNNRNKNNGYNRNNYYNRQYILNKRRMEAKKRKMKLICVGGAVLLALCVVIGCIIGGCQRGTSDMADTQTDSHIAAPDSGTVRAPDTTHTVDTSAPTADITTQHTPTTVPDEWNMLLVNPWNELPEDFSVELTQLQNGHSVDTRVYPDLQAMIDDMRAEGLSPLICSSYRTFEYQQNLYDKQVKKYIDAGWALEDAETEAAKWVAIPGTSEHHTGMAVDIVDLNYQLLNEQQEQTEVQKWLMANSYKYGFILRYPNDKSDITGIYYEPWHYRYVGKDAAKEIYEQGVCLEEYLEGLT